MLARILFVFLLAMNLAAGAWWYLRPTPPVEPFRAALPGVTPLLLLQERNAEDMAAAARASADVEAGADARASAICAVLGPFETQSDLSRAMALLTPQVERIQFREATQDITRGYWVYLPAYESRDAALRSARQLNAAGVRDYYVVTAGDRENTVSLGLFRDRDNASRRQSQIAALGFPARMEERTEVQRQYWIEFEQRGEEEPDWSELPGSERLDQRRRSCG